MKIAMWKGSICLVRTIGRCFHRAEFMDYKQRVVILHFTDLRELEIVGKL